MLYIPGFTHHDGARRVGGQAEHESKPCQCWREVKVEEEDVELGRTMTTWSIGDAGVLQNLYGRCCGEGGASPI